MATETAAGLRYSSRTGRWVLAATVLGSGIAALDATVVGIALPAIGRDFHATVASMQWVIDGYTLPLAGLLLLGGALGDVHGRRKVFVIGTVWFALASLACGLAPNADFLIAARALQGVGAALLTPGSLAILQASFAPDDRSKAIGAWSGLGGVATAIGPFLGGWLIGAVSWRLVFFINLPVAAAVVVIAARHVPESRAPGPRQPLDAAGAATISLALAGLTYGLIAASADGWASPTVLTSLLAGAALLAAFCVVELRSSHPMLPLTIFRTRQFSAANAVTFVVYGALGGALFLVPVVLQVVSGYSALAAGTAMLPLTAIMLALSARSAALSARIGPRLQMTVGPIVIGVGMVLFTRVQVLPPVHSALGRPAQAAAVPPSARSQLVSHTWVQVALELMSPPLLHSCAEAHDAPWNASVSAQVWPTAAIDARWGMQTPLPSRLTASSPVAAVGTQLAGVVPTFAQLPASAVNTSHDFMQAPSTAVLSGSDKRRKFTHDSPALHEGSWVLP